LSGASLGETVGTCSAIKVIVLLICALYWSIDAWIRLFFSHNL
jgi:hypothetical protein